MDVLESADVVKKLAMQQIRNKLHVIEKLKLFAGAAASSSDAIIQLEEGRHFFVEQPKGSDLYDIKDLLNSFSISLMC